MSQIFNTLLVHPIFNALVYFYHLTGNLGLAIIILTVIVRTILIPFVIPSLKSAKKQKDLQPEIRKIKETHKNDKQLQAQKQMELLKKHGVNPTSGCITQLVMLFMLIALFNVIRTMTIDQNIDTINSSLYFASLKFESISQINKHFLYMDLSKPDPYFILAVLAGALQFVVSKMTMGFAKIGEKAAKETKTQTDDMAYQMQQQMIIMLPIMNVVFGITLPSGVVLYIVVGSIYSLVQTYFINGSSTLKPFKNLLKSGKR